MFTLFHGKMKTTLMHFVLDVAAVLFSHVVQYLAENPFQCVILYRTMLFIWCFYSFISIVTNIYRCSIKMTTVYCCIAIMVSKFIYILIILCKGMPLVCNESKKLCPISCNSMAALGTR